MSGKRIVVGDIPERTTEIHKRCCKDCPSNHLGITPDSYDFLWGSTIEELSEPEAQFFCGWRPNRLCRGNYNRIQQRIEELNKVGAGPE